VHHIILNKPPGVIVAVQTQKPERGRATPTKRPSVKDLLTLENAFRRDHNERIPHPKYLMGLKIVRGLNVHDSGMIVFTQCKHAWSKIVKSHNVEKEYIVRLKYSKTRDTSLLDPSMTAIIDLKLEKLREGVTSRSRELLEVVKVEIVNDDEIRMILKEERAHHVRRMLETVRWEVETMKRVRIAEIALEDLPEGKWRYLAPHEHFFKTDPRLPQ
jgi:23S rRNA pseudouridine2604 synthase